MDDYCTRGRRAFRAGWVAGIRAEPDAAPCLENADFDSRWSQGFHEGTRLRLTWKVRAVRAG